MKIEKYLPLLKVIEAVHGPVGASYLSTNKELGMSQATIGRKLVFLEKQGLLIKVSNKGRMLTAKGYAALKNNEISLSKNKIAAELVHLSTSENKCSLLEIMRVRILLEPYAAQKAAENANEASIINLENMAYAHRYMLSQGKPANQEDLGFHLAIADMCGNLTLKKILELLLTNNNAYVEFSKAGDAQRDLQVQQHFRILDTIRRRDNAAASEAMLEHLESVRKDVDRILEK